MAYARFIAPSGHRPSGGISSGTLIVDGDAGFNVLAEIAGVDPVRKDDSKEIQGRSAALASGPFSDPLFNSHACRPDRK